MVSDKNILKRSTYPFVLDPTRADTETTPQELELILNRMAEVTREVADKKSTLKAEGIKRLLFRCASIIIDLKWVGLLVLGSLMLCALTRRTVPSRFAALSRRSAFRSIHINYNLLWRRSLVLGHLGKTTVRSCPLVRIDNCVDRDDRAEARHIFD